MKTKQAALEELSQQNIEFFEYEVNLPQGTRTAHGFRIKLGEITFCEKKGFGTTEHVVNAARFQLRKLARQKVVEKIFGDRGGVVYFLGNRKMGIVKIGRAGRNKAKERLDSLQTGCPFRLRLFGILPSKDAIETERSLHQKFKHLRLEGEWFRYGKEIEDLIESI